MMITIVIITMMVIIITLTIMINSTKIVVAVCCCSLYNHFLQLGKYSLIYFYKMGAVATIDNCVQVFHSNFNDE